MQRSERFTILIGALGRALIVSLLSGAVIGAAFAVWIAAANHWSEAWDTAALGLELAGLYAVVGLAVTGASAVLLAAAGIAPRTRVLLALLIGFYVFLNGLLRFSMAVQPVSVTPHLPLVGAIDLIAVAALSAAVVAAFLTSRPARALGWLTGAGALLAALWTLNVYQERPLRRDLAAVVPEALGPGPSGAPATSDAFEHLKVRLIVLGFDGLSWEVLLPLLEEGELPAFRALLQDAAYGYLDTFEYTISPVVWETISTGKRPFVPGIGYHQHFDVPGVDERVRRLPYYRLCNSPMGLRRLLALTKGIGLWSQRPASSEDARAARLWEILSSRGLRVGVFDWLNTTPVSAINGFIHGNGPLEPADFPPNLLEGVPAMSQEDATEVRGGAVWSHQISGYEAALWHRFIYLSLAFQPDVLFYYTHSGDATNHLNWKADVVGPGLFHLSLRHPTLRPGKSITEVNRLLDSIVGETRARATEDATIVVVSDHGFDFRGYEHDNAPPGVLIVRGPGIRPGPFAGASIEDVTPTLLHLLGVPVGEDMDGRVLPLALPGGPLDRPVTAVASYGPASPPLAPGSANEDELRKHEEYLRALGYVN